MNRWKQTKFEENNQVLLKGPYFICMSDLQVPAHLIVRWHKIALPVLLSSVLLFCFNVMLEDKGQQTAECPLTGKDLIVLLSGLFI